MVTSSIADHRRGGSGTTQGDLLQGQQFVYDGLTLYRVDQIYDDDDSNGLSDTDEWRDVDSLGLPLDLESAGGFPYIS